MQMAFCIVAALLLSATSAMAAPRVYQNPSIGGMRLDWCLNWSAKCGKPAADAYCRSRGSVGAVDFSQASGVGQTKLITGRVCNGPTCAGFRHITCAG